MTVATVFLKGNKLTLFSFGCNIFLIVYTLLCVDCVTVFSVFKIVLLTSQSIYAAKTKSSHTYLSRKQIGKFLYSGTPPIY